MDVNHNENITNAENITAAAPRSLHWAAAKLVLLPANLLTCAVISTSTWGKVVSCDSVIASHRLQLDLFNSFYCDCYSPLQYLRKGNNIKIHPNMPQYAGVKEAFFLTIAQYILQCFSPTVL